ncbi:hypothetical protein RJ639_042521 [Escallonia herrerae]|uniref:Uncharacterized protein n=1 Tax=Escallonia herrerae TaxID=1293975 RepID=A0AA88WGY4_9ASTE|nr:hypothetical protein RJ639_042521 [Escallonia herrerae]
MSKPWGSIGAWAADAERAEAEEKEAAAAAAGDSQSFPSLREAATTKQKKKTKMTLQEFTLGPGAAASRLTTDEMLRLPTGPKERSAEEMQYGGGGGFSSYGRQPGRVSRDEDGGRRHYGGFDDDRRGPPPRVSDYDQPSRADEVDNWALTKKPLQSFDSGGGRPNRYANLGGGGGGGGGGGFNSRADEVDNWGAGKKPMPPPRSSNFGSGFRDSGPEPDRWTRGGGGGGIGGGYRDSVPENDRWANQERSRLVLDPPKGERAVVEPVKSNRPSPFGAARPREDILAEKGLDWRKVDMEMEGKRPASSHSSRPGSAQSAQSEGTAVEGGVKPRPKVNPFGDAKPREVLLQEKGLDWRKIDLDLEHRSIDRLMLTMLATECFDTSLMVQGCDGVNGYNLFDCLKKEERMTVEQLRAFVSLCRTWSAVIRDRHFIYSVKKLLSYAFVTTIRCSLSGSLALGLGIRGTCLKGLESVRSLAGFINKISSITFYKDLLSKREHSVNLVLRVSLLTPDH